MLFVEGTVAVLLAALLVWAGGRLMSRLYRAFERRAEDSGRGEAGTATAPMAPTSRREPPAQATAQAAARQPRASRPPC